MWTRCFPIISQFPHLPLYSPTGSRLGQVQAIWISTDLIHRSGEPELSLVNCESYLLPVSLMTFLKRVSLVHAPPKSMYLCVQGQKGQRAVLLGGEYKNLTRMVPTSEQDHVLRKKKGMHYTVHSNGVISTIKFGRGNR